MTTAVSAFFSGALASGGGSGARTASVDVGTGPGLRYFIAALHNAGAPTDEITAVSVGGEALSNLSIARADTGREFTLWGGYITVTGTQTLSASYTGDDFYSFRGGFVVIDDMPGSTPIGTPVIKTNTGTGPNSDSATCPANGLIVSFMHHFFVMAAPTYTGTGTSHVAAKNGDFAFGIASRSDDGAHSWTTTTSNDWSVIMVPVNGATGSGGGAPAKAFRIIHG